jgi:hypothetical protein
MAALCNKTDVLKALESLPEEHFSLEDLIERLVVIQKIRIGLSQKGQGVPHEEVVKQLQRPREDREW